ncbi:hypothetical protein JFK97_19110 [Chromobacterium phragmitis]|uniref:hypothetical protein n=1 Tax=Chromobacterium amazonense TaxID=1382803 RepID=UPI0021B83D27|nr:hypothetical protein [Chromobacterium amazonense]MBM2886503.1 hypothetical protein [Chromobacterium amazonense]
MKKSLLTLLLATVSAMANAAPASAPATLTSGKSLKKPLVCDFAEVQAGVASKACNILAGRLNGVDWLHAVMRDTGDDTAVLVLDRKGGLVRCHVVMRPDVMPKCEPGATN